MISTFLTVHLILFYFGLIGFLIYYFFFKPKCPKITKCTCPVCLSEIELLDKKVNEYAKHLWEYHLTNLINYKLDYEGWSYRYEPFCWVLRDNADNEIARWCHMNPDNEDSLKLLEKFSVEEIRKFEIIYILINFGKKP